MKNSGERAIYEQITEAQETSEENLHKHWKNECLAGRIQPNYTLEVFKRTVDAEKEAVMLQVTAGKYKPEVITVAEDVMSFLINLFNKGV